MAAAMMLVVFAGFARTFYLSSWLEPGRSATSDSVFYVHGTVFTAWIVFLIVQPTLIAAGHIRLHRKLGWLGGAVAAAVVITGVHAGLVAAARPADAAIAANTPEFLGVILFGIVLYGLLVGLALAFRNDSQYHKRFMLLATINLLQAAVVRFPLDLPGDFGPVTTFLYADAFILPLLVWDIAVLRRIHPATIWGGLAIIISLPVRFWFSGTALWLTIAEWAVALVR